MQEGSGRPQVHIGTSGWQYPDWRGSFYPTGVPQARWLEHYATVFATVELNTTFYRLPPERIFADWRHRTPSGFTFAVKASRYLTHVRRLRDPRSRPPGYWTARQRWGLDEVPSWSNSHLPFPPISRP